MPEEAAVPPVVVRRFPHLGGQIMQLANSDPNFLGLCEDYGSLVASLASLGDRREKDREELGALKASLEVEILERLTLRPNTADKRDL